MGVINIIIKNNNNVLPICTCGALTGAVGSVCEIKTAALTGDFAVLEEIRGGVGAGDIWGFARFGKTAKRFLL